MRWPSLTVRRGREGRSYCRWIIQFSMLVNRRGEPVQNGLSFRSSGALDVVWQRYRCSVIQALQASYL